MTIVKLSSLFDRRSWAKLAWMLLAPALLAALVLPSYHNDIRRLVALGVEFPLMGTTHHPPLTSWLAWAVSRIPFHDGWLAILVQAALNALAIWAWLRVGARFLSPAQLRLATIAMAGSLVMTFWSLPGYSLNEDMVQIPLWALTILWLIRAIKTPHRTGNWVILGLFVGLSALTKYYVMLLLAAVVLASLQSTEQRKLWRTSGPWLTIMTTAIVVSPHAFWVLNNSANMGFFWDRLNFSALPIITAFSQLIMALVGPVVLGLPGLALLMRRRNAANVATVPKQLLTRILIWFLLLSALLAVTGSTFWLRYQAPIIGLFIILAAGRTPTDGPQDHARSLNIVTGLITSLAVLIGATYLFGRGHGVSQEPGPELAAFVQTEWSKSYECGPSVAISDRYTSELLALYHEPQIAAFIFRNSGAKRPRQNQLEHGAVLVSRDDPGLLDNMAKAFSAATPPDKVTLGYRRNLTDTSTSYYFSFVAPTNCDLPYTRNR